MKKIKILSLLFVFVFLPICFCTGCKSRNEFQNLNAEQKEAYESVVAYAGNCDNENLDNTLEEIMIDMETYSDLENEVEIAKLKIDNLNYEQKMNNEITQESNTSQRNKNNYLQKRNAITNKYYGTQTQYNNEVYTINKLIGQEYANCIKDVSNINSSNMGQGYKKSKVAERERQRDKKIAEYNKQLSTLKTKWENKQSYDNYNSLYNSEDSKLNTKISTIRSNYNKLMDNNKTKINNLIKNR